MSYEIAKGIKIDNKKKKIFIRSTSNNVYPKPYSKWEYLKNEPDLEIKKRRLFYDLVSGNINLRICENINMKYAIERFKNYCYENTIDISLIYDLAHKEGELNNIEKYYKIFEEFYNEKYDGKYFLISDIGKIIKINNRGFLYNKDLNIKESECKSYKKLYCDRSRLSKNTIEKYNIRIEKYEKIKEYNDGDLIL